MALFHLERYEDALVAAEHVYWAADVLLPRVEDRDPVYARMKDLADRIVPFLHITPPGPPPPSSAVAVFDTLYPTHPRDVLFATAGVPWCTSPTAVAH